MKWVGVLGVLFLLVFTNCAKEQSKEQRVQEEVIRKKARLSKAAGDYRGFLNHGGDQVVPVNLTITVQSNPTNGDDNPVLQGSLRIGLFGGVQLASNAGSFDWADGRISFTFERSSAAGNTKALEVRAYYQDGVLTNAVLDAPRQGLFPLDLKRDAPALFSSDQQYNYGWRTPGVTANVSPFPSEPTPDALLTVNLRDESFPAPGNLDLPYVPGLNATVRFSPLGKSPETASTVIYDPIGGTIDLYFSQVSLLHFDGLFLNHAANDLSPDTVGGYIALGSVEILKVQVKRVPQSTPVTILPLPGRRYRGIYQASGQPFRAEVYVDYQGGEMANTAEFPFPLFPKLRLEFVTCIGLEAQRRRVLDLVSVDHLNGVAAFRVVGSPNPKDLELKYSSNWDSLDGYFMQGDGLGTIRPRLSVTPRTFSGDECADDPRV
jgi:hypothetical protein